MKNRIIRRKKNITKERKEKVLKRIFIGVPIIWRFIISSVFIIAAICTIALFLNGYFKTDYSGYLLPDNKPNPYVDRLDTIDKSKYGCSVIFGTGLAYSDKFPFTVIKIKGNPILSANKDEFGMWVDAKIFDDQGIILAIIEKNEFTLNSNNSCSIKRPDEHTLKVFDRDYEEILTVEYVNPETMRFFGELNYPGNYHLSMNENGISVNGRDYITGMTMINCGTAVNIR